MWRKVAMPLVAFFFASCSRHVRHHLTRAGPFSALQRFW